MPLASGQPAPRSRRHLAPPRTLLLGAMVVGVLGVAALISGSLLPTVLQTAVQGVLILPLLTAAAMLGLALTAPLARTDTLQDSAWADIYRLILAVALGLGVISLSTLLVGLAHAAYDWPLLLIIVAAGAAGFPATRAYFRKLNRRPIQVRLHRFDAVLLLSCIPLAILLIATTFPPMTLWSTEGNGYDVLEYHLQLPREYLALHSTWPLHHNVYSYLPGVMEMLYTTLLAFVHVVYQSPESVLVVFPAQILHATITVLAAAAVALVPTKMPTAGRALAFVLFLAVPWTIVVGSLAYNDGLVLLYGALAFGLALGRPSRAGMLTLATLLGLAVGTKMTAGVMVAIPVAALLLAQGRFRHLLIAALLALVVYSPWAIRSMVDTYRPGQLGNPVFPIAARTLGLGHWTPAQADRWARGHQPPPEERSLEGRVRALASQSLLDRQFSPNLATLDLWLADPGVPGGPPQPAGRLHRLGLIWLVVPLILLVALSRGRVAWHLLLALALQVLAWLLFTHLQARFLLPALIPVAMLTALSAEPLPWVRAVIGAAIGLQAASVAFLLLPEAGLFGGPQRPDAPYPIGLFVQAPEAFLAAPPPEGPLPNDTTIYLVGEATPFYYHTRVLYHTVFDGEPLADALAAGGPPAVLQYLRERHVDYVLINWAEVDRLRRTYGYPEDITREAFERTANEGLSAPPFQMAPPRQVYKLTPR